MERREVKGLALLREARQKARTISDYFPIPIYLGTDGPYSVEFPNDRKAVFCVAVDKNGAKYHIGKVHDVCIGRMKPGHVRV